jgi:hypothetical protein
MDEKKIEHPTAFSNIILLARENKPRTEKTRFFVREWRCRRSVPECVPDPFHDHAHIFVDDIPRAETPRETVQKEINDQQRDDGIKNPSANELVEIYDKLDHSTFATMN